MADNVEDLTVDYEEDGKLVSRQLDKEILTKGAWSTIIFRYQDWDRKKEEYGPDKYSIRRYQVGTRPKKLLPHFRSGWPMLRRIQLIKKLQAEQFGFLCIASRLIPEIYIL